MEHSALDLYNLLEKGFVLYLSESVKCHCFALLVRMINE